MVLAALALASWCLDAQARELEPNQVYAGGTTVESSTLGVAFVVPPDWVGRFGQDARHQVLMLGSTTTEGVGLVVLQPDSTAAEMVAGLREPQDLGGGVVLRPTAPPSVEGPRITSRYESELYVGRALGLIGPARSSVIFFFAGPTKNEEVYGRLLEGLEASTRFREPALASTPPVAPSPTGLGQAWTSLLAGQALHYFSSYNSGGGGGGMSQQRVLHLCADGQFAYSGSSLVTMNVPGATGSSGGRDGFRGRWTLESPTQTTAVLVLTPDGGGQVRWPLRYEAQKTFLNSQRWFREPSKACR